MLNGYWQSESFEDQPTEVLIENQKILVSGLKKYIHDEDLVELLIRLEHLNLVINTRGRLATLLKEVITEN